MKKDVAGLPLPKTNIQEVLYTIIEKGSVSLFDFPYLAGFRTRVSELKKRHKLKFVTIAHTRCNKFGNTYTYHIHSLKRTKSGRRIEAQHKNAIKLYKKITNA